MTRKYIQNSFIAVVLLSIFTVTPAYFPASLAANPEGQVRSEHVYKSTNHWQLAADRWKFQSQT